MAINATIEAPNFERIEKESGQFTSDAINLLWAALNDTRQTQRRDARRATESLEPLVLTLAPSGNLNNIDTTGASIVSFTGSSNVDVTGFRAPETGHSRLIFCQVNGTGTITFKHNVTSETANRVVLASGADTARVTNTGIILVYLQSRWREVGKT